MSVSHSDQLRRCWACSFRWTNAPDCRARAEMYEIVVEFIEEWQGTFTIMALCDAYNAQSGTRRWRWHTVFSNAVHDMARHGLVRCISRRDRRCYLWEKADVPTSRGLPTAHLP